MPEATSCETSSRFTPIVTTRVGKLQGLIYQDFIYAYYGVPYAKKPIDQLRFQNPVPVEPWEGIRFADTAPPPAASLTKDKNGKLKLSPNCSEDCLYLNIYTPSVKSNDKYPVMVYLHGGAFTFDNANVERVGPDYLVPLGVILVTINYRLGPFGFLNLMIPECLGNFGLKDQNLALKWIRDNILAFGGDPENVTLFGQSAGAAAVQYHMISPKSRNLFHRVILQSGSALNRRTFSRYPEKSGILLAEKIANRTVTCSKDALEILKNAEMENILRQAETVFPEIEGVWAGEFNRKSSFAPSVEIENENSFLTKMPKQALIDGDSVDVPAIMGVNADESIFVLPDENFVPTTLLDYERLLPKETGVQLGSNKAEEGAELIKQFYFSKGDPQRNYIQATSDGLFVYGVVKTGMLLASDPNWKSPIYFYKFWTARNSSLVKKNNNVTSVSGTCHGDELEYLFTGKNYEPLKTPEEISGKNMLTQLWTNFAKNGSVPQKWVPYQKPENSYIEIKEQIETKQEFYTNVIAFWDKLYKLMSDK